MNIDTYVHYQFSICSSLFTPPPPLYPLPCHCCAFVFCPYIPRSLVLSAPHRYYCLATCLPRVLLVLGILGQSVGILFLFFVLFVSFPFCSFSLFPWDGDGWKKESARLKEAKTILPLPVVLPPRRYPCDFPVFPHPSSCSYVYCGKVAAARIPL